MNPITRLDHQADHGSLSRAELTIAIRPLSFDDHAYVRSTWLEGYKTSTSGFLRTPWPLYKQTIGRELAGIIGTAATLGAYRDDGSLAGWLAYSPGRSVDTVHWMYVRNQVRRRGVMAAIVAQAELGQRICYTHRGSRDVAHRGRSQRSPDAARSQGKGPTMDEPMADWLRAQGRSVVFVPFEEWAA